jgi:hypothetical protein
MKAELQKKWGQMTIGPMGEKKWASNLLLPILVFVVYGGHTKVPSGIQFKNPYLLDVFAEYRNLYNPPPIKVVSENTMITFVNRNSLLNFIEQTDNVEYSAYAKKIYNSLDMYDMFTQELSTKNDIEGRIYLSGINLQNCKKEITAAALSGQYIYDADCAVFGIFAAVADELTNTSMPYTLNYINNKGLVRDRISEDTGLSIDEVKQCLISAGFGKRAKSQSNLQVILYASEDGKNLIDEFRKCSTVIFKHYKQDGMGTDLEKNKTETRSKQLSKLFFRWETELMDEFIRCSNQQPNMRKHDAVVLLQEVNIKHIVKKMKVSFTSHLEYFNFSGKQI